MKRFIAALASFALAGTLFGCSSSEPAEPADEDTGAPAEVQDEAQPQELQITDSGYILSEGYVYYAVEVKNPNAAYGTADATLHISSKAADGAIVFTDDWDIGPIPPESTTCWATQAGNGNSQDSDTVTFTINVNDDSGWMPTDKNTEKGLYDITDASIQTDEAGFYDATGEIKLKDATPVLGIDPKTPMIVCVLRDSTGKIVTGFEGYQENDLKPGETTTFDISSAFGGVDYASADVYANPWY